MLSAITIDEINRKQNNLLFFYARWLPLSMYKRMFTSLNNLEKEYSSHKFYALDVENPEFSILLNKYNVKAVPCIVINTNEDSEKLNGSILTSALRAYLNKVYKQHGFEKNR